MKEYLKMADVFGIGVSVRDKAPRLIECGGVLAANCLCEQSAEYTAHAINSHDELVANVRHYRSESDTWERRAINEASKVRELHDEIEGLEKLLSVCENLDDAKKTLCDMNDVFEKWKSESK